MDIGAIQQHRLEAHEPSDPVSGQPVPEAWDTQVPTITLIACKRHGRKRVNATLEA